MSRKPNFDELVGGDDLSSAESERLRRVHDLLVAAGPPPDFEPAEPPAPPAASVTRLVPRRRVALVALAAAFLVAAFGAGYFAGDRSPGAERVVAMTGTPQAAAASASLRVYQLDSAGNWPMKLEVKGLAPSRNGRPYELWLAKHGRLAALCGSFLPKADGTATVRMNAPYRLSDYDSWVIVSEGSTTPLLTTA
jgi:Anti-sigma-K factor rskA